MTENGKNSGKVHRKTVAEAVLLEYSLEKELYFFPGLTIDQANLPQHMIE